MSVDVSRLERALLALAELVEEDPVYIPIFRRLDAELSAATANPGAKLARIRAMLARDAA